MEKLRSGVFCFCVFTRKVVSFFFFFVVCCIFSAFVNLLCGMKSYCKGKSFSNYGLEE